MNIYTLLLVFFGKNLSVDQTDLKALEAASSKCPAEENNPRSAEVKLRLEAGTDKTGHSSGSKSSSSSSKSSSSGSKCSSSDSKLSSSGSKSSSSGGKSSSSGSKFSHPVSSKQVGFQENARIIISEMVGMAIHEIK